MTKSKSKATDKEYTIFALKGTPTEAIKMGATVKRNEASLKEAEGLSLMASNGIKILVIGEDAETFNGVKPSDTGIGGTLFINSGKVKELIEVLPTLGFEVYPSILTGTVEAITTKSQPVDSYTAKHSKKKSKGKKVYLHELAKDNVSVSDFITALKQTEDNILADHPDSTITVHTEEMDAMDFVELFDIVPSEANPDEEDAFIILQDAGFEVDEQTEIILVTYLKYTT